MFRSLFSGPVLVLNFNLMSHKSFAMLLAADRDRYMLWKQCLLLSTYLRRTFTCTLNLSRHLATSPPRHFAISPSCYLATLPSRYLATSPSCHLGPAQLNLYESASCNRNPAYPQHPRSGVAISQTSRYGWLGRRYLYTEN